jgi:hypothetical protein
MSYRTTVTFLSVALSCLLTACGRESADQPGDVEAASVPAVEAVEARTGGLPLIERLTGTVRAAGEVAIFPQSAGQQNASRTSR